MAEVKSWDFGRYGLRVAMIPLHGFIGPDPIKIRVGSEALKLVDGIDGHFSVLQRKQKWGIMSVTISSASTSNATLFTLNEAGAQFPIDSIALPAGLNEIIHFANGLVMGMPRELTYGPKSPQRTWEILFVGITPVLVGS